MKEININDFNPIFSMIKQEWFLISAQYEEKKNAMTAGWGGIGVIFNKNVVTIYVRPQRYTYELIRKSHKFSISFFNSKFKDTLNYFGTISGKNENKIKKSGLTLEVFDNSYPIFKEAEINILCDSILSMQFDKVNFENKEIMEFYPNNDYHYMFIGEIKKIFIK